MKIRGRGETGGERGITLIECLVYCGVIVVVLGAAFTAFYRYWDNSKSLRRNADDIVRALHAGEQWRADIRAATGPIQVTGTPGDEQLRIPVSAGEIVYTFSKNELRRQNGSAARVEPLLHSVKSSQMQPDSRGRVTAWRWELELKSAQKRTRLRPLFTFEAVAATAINQ